MFSVCSPGRGRGGISDQVRGTPSLARAGVPHSPPLTWLGLGIFHRAPYLARTVVPFLFLSPSSQGRVPPLHTHTHAGQDKGSYEEDCPVLLTIQLACNDLETWCLPQGCYRSWWKVLKIINFFDTDTRLWLIQGTHISGETKFHDISMIFPGFFKFQVYFQEYLGHQLLLHKFLHNALNIQA